MVASGKEDESRDGSELALALILLRELMHARKTVERLEGGTEELFEMLTPFEKGVFNETRKLYETEGIPG